MPPVLIATSNPGKLRDFAAAAASHGLEVAGVPGFAELPEVSEDGVTFEANARKKAEFYSRFAPGSIVLADDSGLEVEELRGAPGVLSARFAATANGNASDETNNAKLLTELQGLPQARRTAKFVAVLAAARNGMTLAVFRGEAQGVVLDSPRGAAGFGYDPLFLVPELGKSFAELSPKEKAAVSHRGQAFRKFLDWFQQQAI
jgi:XTP/dITP diphosphohydrolase